VSGCQDQTLDSFKGLLLYELSEGVLGVPCAHLLVVAPPGVVDGVMEPYGEFHLERVVGVAAGLSEIFETQGYVAQVVVVPVGLAVPFH